MKTDRWARFRLKSALIHEWGADFGLKRIRLSVLYCTYTICHFDLGGLIKVDHGWHPSGFFLFRGIHTFFFFFSKIMYLVPLV